MTPPKKLNKYLLITALFIAACNDAPPPATVNTTAAENDLLVPAVIGYNIVNQYPHDTKAFTEGLEYKDGFLYESTGQYEVSDLRKVELTTGKVVQSTKMEARYFGEGMTILNGKIYQLTYREGKGFVYDFATLKKESSFSFPTQEGWGMTNNGSQLIFNDGGNVLYFMDPATFSVVKQVQVTDERGPVNQINEMELIKGYIYANRWQSDVILKIDTATGKVVARADLSSIRQQAGIPQFSGREDGPDVLNGIAYDAATNRIFVTGKNWPKVFEVTLDN
jgi:glutaminyl-peptide cyclotransferase